VETSYDDLVAAIRAGLGRCQRRWFRELSVALDPDGVTHAEQVIAQTIIEELDGARYQVRRRPPAAFHGATEPARR
jgi:hypothetical protein